MLVHEQFTQAGMYLAHGRLGLHVVEIQAHGEGINEHAHSFVSSLTSLHAPKQHCAEHDPLVPAAARQHLPPRQVAQGCQAHSQPPGLSSQAFIQFWR